MDLENIDESLDRDETPTCADCGFPMTNMGELDVACTRPECSRNPTVLSCPRCRGGELRQELVAGYSNYSHEKCGFRFDELGLTPVACPACGTMMKQTDDEERPGGFVFSCSCGRRDMRASPA